MAERGSPPYSPTRSLLEEEGSDLMLGRALLGWLPEEAAYRLLCPRRRDLTLSIEGQARLAAAWDCVRSRRGPPSPAGVVTPLPEQLAAHEAALREAAPELFGPGYELCMVDLSRVCALAEAVIVDRAVARAAPARDLVSLAALTLPVTVPSFVEPSFDDELGAWVVVSDNPNLRLVGSFSFAVHEPPTGATALGLLVRAVPSRVTVASYEGRYLLEDGYHRAIGLLALGITVVPALVHGIEGPEDLSVHGMLRQARWAGPHPPLLPDYLDDAVSADVWMPAPQKIIMVQGLELDGPDDGEVTGEYDFPPAASPAAGPVGSSPKGLTPAPRAG